MKYIKIEDRIACFNYLINEYVYDNNILDEKLHLV